MEGVTEGSFVELFTALQLVDAWFTPFIRISSGVPRLSRFKARLSPFLSSGLPVIAQLLGTESELLAQSAARLHSLGVLCVDLNCACPSPQVLSSGGGGKRLLQPQWIKDTLLAMKAASNGRPISIKLRCAYKDIAEMEEIAAAVREASPALVTCHFRTVQEMYEPVPHGYERLAKMHSLLDDIPFFGSGDLFTVQDAIRMYDIAQVDGVAPARGLMKNPMLLREIRMMCQGLPTELLQMSSQEKLVFLRKIGQMSGQSKRHQVFLLKIARTMFGEESPEFRQLLAEIRCSARHVLIHWLVRRRSLKRRGRKEGAGSHCLT